MVDAKQLEIQEAAVSLFRKYSTDFEKAIDDGVLEYVRTGAHYDTATYGNLFYLVFGELVGVRQSPTLFSVKHKKVISEMVRNLRKHLMEQGHLTIVLQNKELTLVILRVYLRRAFRYSDEKRAEYENNNANMVATF